MVFIRHQHHRKRLRLLQVHGAAGAEVLAGTGNAGHLGLRPGTGDGRTTADLQPLLPAGAQRVEGKWGSTVSWEIYK